MMKVRITCTLDSLGMCCGSGPEVVIKLPHRVPKLTKTRDAQRCKVAQICPYELYSPAPCEVFIPLHTSHHHGVAYFASSSCNILLQARSVVVTVNLAINVATGRSAKHRHIFTQRPASQRATGVREGGWDDFSARVGIMAHFTSVADWIRQLGQRLAMQKQTCRRVTTKRHQGCREACT